MSSPMSSGFPGPAPPAPGTIVGGKYRVEETLGSGGMGVVVRATHVQLREAVAIKFLHGEVARDQEQVERLLREARATVRIKSEHVTRVLDVGTLPGGAPFMAMELLVGEDLQEISDQQGALPVPEAVEYLVQACRGLAEAHRQGIVHRDLKPSNLFLTRRADGSPLVKLLDFGISKSTDEQSLTMTGDVLGSPLYMSPEQIRDCRLVDARSDIFALGSILFKLLTGRAPFLGPNSAGTLAKIVADPAPPIRPERPDVSPDLEAIVLRCLAKNPALRFQTVDELAAALSGTLRFPAGEAIPRVRFTPTMRMAAPEVPVSVPQQATVVLPGETTATAGSITTAQRQGAERQGEAERARSSAVVVASGALLLILALGGTVALAVARRAPPSAPTASPPDPAPAPVPEIAQGIGNGNGNGNAAGEQSSSTLDPAPSAQAALPEPPGSAASAAQPPPASTGPKPRAGGRQPARGRLARERGAAPAGPATKLPPLPTYGQD